jgi:hypothetical protein
MRYTVLGVAAAVAVVIAIVVGGSAPAQTPTGTTLTFKEPARGGQFKFIDNPPRARHHKPGLGDEFVFNNSLQGTDGTPAGQVSAHCALTRTTKRDGVFVCTGIAELKDGLLFLDARSTVNGSTTSGAVTGGTGAYANARGTFTSTDHKDGSSDDTIQLVG